MIISNNEQLPRPQDHISEFKDHSDPLDYLVDKGIPVKRALERHRTDRGIDPEEKGIPKDDLYRSMALDRAEAFVYGLEFKDVICDGLTQENIEEVRTLIEEYAEFVRGFKDFSGFSEGEYGPKLWGDHYLKELSLPPMKEDPEELIPWSFYSDDEPKHFTSPEIRTVNLALGSTEMWYFFAQLWGSVGFGGAYQAEEELQEAIDSMRILADKGKPGIDEARLRAKEEQLRRRREAEQSPFILDGQL